MRKEEIEAQKDTDTHSPMKVRGERHRQRHKDKDSEIEQVDAKGGERYIHIFTMHIMRQGRKKEHGSIYKSKE